MVGSFKDYDHNIQIPQTILKKALDEELQFIGRAFQDLLYDRLLTYGIVFTNDSKHRAYSRSYSMTQLEGALLGIFGKEALELIMERLYDVLAVREWHAADERKEKQ